ncbi:amidase signature domain-containing protein [Aspergillus pseudoustus]|uniref:Amidase signature domain-containing protein n=1 Tax=Aspergillus pseudoustus TaxID=1810923 RepID=A0ABR4INW4_9EURO
MTDLEPFRLTGSEALARFRSGELTVTAYAQSLLARIDKRDSAVHAWAYLDPDYVLEQAAKLDAIPSEERGPLHGVAVGVKDIIYTKDMPTQHNSPIYEGDFPALDAGCVRILRNAGALIFGKTHTAQFGATSVCPPTRNPHNQKHSPGGSSSGSAAAVADLHVPISLGTQTGGSTIRPGSYNGIYAFKPTWNTVSRDGAKVFSLILDTIGFYSRSVADLQLLATVFQLEDDKTPEEEGEEPDFRLTGAKFAAVKTAAWPTICKSSIAAFEKGIALLRAHGATVELVDLPTEFDSVLKLHDIEMYSSGRVSFLPEYVSAREKLLPSIAGFVENSNKYTKREAAMALDEMAALRPKFDRFASKYAAVLTPTASDVAPEGATGGNYAFSVTWTSLHVPVVNIPGFKGGEGLPIGLSLIASRYRDEHLLRVCRAVGEVFEAEGGWTRNMP